MQVPRRARFLARVMLAWFVLALGAAVASPLVQPKSIELICTGSGAIKLLVNGEDGGVTPAGHGADCPLCATVGPPPPAAVAAPSGQPLGRTVQAIPAACIAALASAPLPARGPPAIHRQA